MVKWAFRSAPGERNLAQACPAEVLGTFGNRLAAQPKVEIASGFIVRERPDQEAGEPPFAKLLSRAVEELRSKSQPLIGRAKIALRQF